MDVDLDLSRPASEDPAEGPPRVRPGAARRFHGRRLAALMGCAVVAAAAGAAYGEVSSGPTHHPTPVKSDDSVVVLSTTLPDRESRVVDEGFAQLTLPAGWVAQAETPCLFSVRPGAASALLVGETPADSLTCLPHLRPGRTLAWMFPSNAKGSGRPVGTVDGFKLFAAAGAGRAHGYLVPALRTEVLWIGADPTRLVSSLSYSPLQTVKSAGPVSSTPKGWIHYRYAGGAVAAPPSWPVKRPLVLTCTGPFDNGPVVGLGVRINPVPCAYFPPKTIPGDGVTITSSSQLPACPISFTIRLSPGATGQACSDPLVQPQELQVEVTALHAHTYITLGLGDATVVRTVLGSAS